MSRTETNAAMIANRKRRALQARAKAKGRSLYGSQNALSLRGAIAVSGYASARK